MRIADYIRQYLQNHPEGALTSQVSLYCLNQGCRFNTTDINKSVSGQLSKMCSRGEVTYRQIGREYIWRLI